MGGWVDGWMGGWVDEIAANFLPSGASVFITKLLSYLTFIVIKGMISVDVYLSTEQLRKNSDSGHGSG